MLGYMQSKRPGNTTKPTKPTKQSNKQTHIDHKHIEWFDRKGTLNIISIVIYGKFIQIRLIKGSRREKKRQQTSKTEWIVGN